MSALRSAIALLAALATAPHDISPTSPHAWFASRPRAPSHPPIDSRPHAWLKCGEKNESMLHMIECRHAAPFWQACIKFCKLVLNEEPFANTIDAVIST